MPAKEVQQFIDALAQIESSGEQEAMVSLFADTCKVGNVLAPDRFEGREGASRFWQDYRSSFGEIRSEFHNLIDTAEGAALEWTAQGSNKSGGPVHYQGVTVLRFENGQITRFMSYFDPRGLGRQFEVNPQDSLQEA